MYDNAIGQQYRRAKRARPESLVGPDVVGLPIVRICNTTHHKENIASITHLYALWTILLVIKKRVRCFGFKNESSIADYSFAFLKLYSNTIILHQPGQKLRYSIRKKDCFALLMKIILLGTITFK